MGDPYFLNAVLHWTLEQLLLTPIFSFVFLAASEPEIVKHRKIPATNSVS